MIKAEKLFPIRVRLTLDDIDVLLDGLHALHREIRRNPTYNIPEKLYAHSETQARLDRLSDLHVLITGGGEKALPR